MVPSLNLGNLELNNLITNLLSARERIISEHAAPAADRLDVATNALAYLVFLGGHALTIGTTPHISRGPQSRPIDQTADRPVNDAPHLVLELVKICSFSRAATASSTLLCILGRDASKANRVYLDFDSSPTWHLP